jgi:hypothetical protein
MSSTPTRYPSGLATRPSNHLYGNFPRPDPSQVWQFFDDFNGFTVSAAGLTGWHLDETNTGTGPTMLDEFGGVVQFEADNAQGDGYHYQLAINTTVFEPVKLIAGRKAWFSTCFSIEDADQSLFFIGCHNAADDPLGTEPSDQFGIRSKPGTLGTMQILAGKTNSTEVTDDLLVMADGVRYAVYMFYDGKSTITAQAYSIASDVYTYAGTAEISVTTAGTAGDLLPDTEMTVAFAVEANDTGTDAFQLDWIHVARER